MFQIAYSQGRVLRTSMHAGTYTIGDVRSNKGGASIEVYPESDSTILFYVHIQRGAPSYNLGRLYGRMKVSGGTGVFNTKFDYLENSCRWKITITPKALILITMNNQYDCSFGHGVIADGKYKKINGKKPAYFIQGNGEKIYFSKIKPEQYNATF